MQDSQSIQEKITNAINKNNQNIQDSKGSLHSQKSQLTQNKNFGDTTTNPLYSAENKSQKDQSPLCHSNMSTTNNPEPFRQNDLQNQNNLITLASSFNNNYPNPLFSNQFPGLNQQPNLDKSFLQNSFNQPMQNLMGGGGQKDDYFKIKATEYMKQSENYSNPKINMDFNTSQQNPLEVNKSLQAYEEYQKKLKEISMSEEKLKRDKEELQQKVMMLEQSKISDYLKKSAANNSAPANLIYSNNGGGGEMKSGIFNSYLMGGLNLSKNQSCNDKNLKDDKSSSNNLNNNNNNSVSANNQQILSKSREIQQQSSNGMLQQINSLSKSQNESLSPTKKNKNDDSSNIKQSSMLLDNVHELSKSRNFDNTGINNNINNNNNNININNPYTNNQNTNTNFSYLKIGNSLINDNQEMKLTNSLINSKYNFPEKQEDLVKSNFVENLMLNQSLCKPQNSYIDYNQQIHVGESQDLTLKNSMFNYSQLQNSQQPQFEYIQKLQKFESEEFERMQREEKELFRKQQQEKQEFLKRQRDQFLAVMQSQYSQTSKQPDEQKSPLGITKSQNFDQMAKDMSLNRTKSGNDKSQNLMQPQKIEDLNNNPNPLAGSFIHTGLNLSKDENNPLLTQADPRFSFAANSQFQLSLSQNTNLLSQQQQLQFGLDQSKNQMQNNNIDKQDHKNDGGLLQLKQSSFASGQNMAKIGEILSRQQRKSSLMFNSNGQNSLKNSENFKYKIEEDISQDQNAKDFPMLQANQYQINPNLLGKNNPNQNEVRKASALSFGPEKKKKQKLNLSTQASADESYLQELQDKLKKQNQMIEDFDKETGKRRNQKVWTKEEDFLLKYFHKKFKGKWDLIAEQIPGRNASQSLQRFRKFNNQKSTRSHWTHEEDMAVRNMIDKYGKNWGLIASNLNGRTGKQVRERYINCLDPEINWNEFSTEEDNKIVSFVQSHGAKWSLISKLLPGRPENMLKNRYYAHLKRLQDTEGDKKGKKKNKKGEKIEEKIEEKQQQQLIQNINVQSKEEHDEDGYSYQDQTTNQSNLYATSDLTSNNQIHKGGHINQQQLQQLKQHQMLMQQQLQMYEDKDLQK